MSNLLRKVLTKNWPIGIDCCNVVPVDTVEHCRDRVRTAGFGDKVAPELEEEYAARTRTERIFFPKIYVKHRILEKVIVQAFLNSASTLNVCHLYLDNLIEKICCGYAQSIRVPLRMRNCDEVRTENCTYGQYRQLNHSCKGTLMSDSPSNSILPIVQLPRC
jgi:hypothetical protein